LLPLFFFALTKHTTLNIPRKKEPCPILAASHVALVPISAPEITVLVCQ